MNISPKKPLVHLTAILKGSYSSKHRPNKGRCHHMSLTASGANKKDSELNNISREHNAIVKLQGVLLAFIFHLKQSLPKATYHLRCQEVPNVPDESEAARLSRLENSEKQLPSEVKLKRKGDETGPCNSIAFNSLHLKHEHSTRLWGLFSYSCRCRQPFTSSIQQYIYELIYWQHQTHSFFSYFGFEIR